MFIHVEKAQYITDYQIWLSFNDGAQGVIDLEPELYGDIFEPLQDMDYFKQFKLEGHTLSWPNGADFATEFLREQISISDICEYFEQRMVNPICRDLRSLPAQ